ncbi:alpha/beta hydrolase [Sphingomonas koreensis]|uniref:Alpha/beta hydrolase n=1 Tax=Sphingomonas koreensis TaxID=93064 RepID=A0AAJ4RZQ6_9SPHN|nr:alpha/beta hydrolase [Sphingomonas koreensis]RSU20905.1 alpha/beta hydrolase [Sphingomonas koreensis]RSU23594.1 alpha/beta hydrolase [Sphingomonas koreensis]RSU31050.1 alpha/beta hydrolase [Sphingomonas koreensis]RSU33126.1 alpha/beta hydrolase [Sphingomonas koreensis]
MLALFATAPALARQDSAAVEVPAFTLPPSDQLSEEAKSVLLRMRAARAPDLKGDIARQRAFYQKYNDDRLAEMRRHFRTREERASLGGVAVDVVVPGAGITPGNKDRVLINVHGGAFMWGSGSGALVEAIPIAATMGIKVVTVDYRLTPEHRYPAASEDVTAVYRALLRQYRPEQIGIYGCSAGGVITAQSVAWIRKQGLPRPGAIGTFCGTAAGFSGDSPYLAGPIAEGTVPPAGPLPKLLPTAYMAGVAGEDAAAYPLLSDAEIKAFPPTLLLAGSRDFAASALTLAHRRLAQAGVPSELFLFDGLPHAFFVWPDMPESIEAYRVITRFFDTHLGRRK